ncbi:MAG: EcoRI family type II restriction endonuclease [Phycisphaerales bacterium]|nr:EcoRI family type II restriction endonuclease [Phycisphaerales bacterium]
MAKKQTDRLRIEKLKSSGPKEIFRNNAQIHDKLVNNFSKVVFEKLKKDFPNLEFRFRDSLYKKEINEKLNSVDSRLGITIFVEKASIKPDGGIIEVKDKNNNWRIVLVCEAKHQGKDIDNIRQGILVGKNNNQELMVAGNAIERSHKNINEIRNIMINEKHFPYILFLQGSNFLTEPETIKRPDGTEVILKHDIGSLNRIDRLTSANYSLPINKNSCENIFITIDGKSVMLQAVSIYTKSTEWTIEEMLPINDGCFKNFIKNFRFN